MLSPAASKKPKTFKLRALGLCGADDSVNPNLLAMISHSYPFVEFGVLFRPDKVLYIVHILYIQHGFALQFSKKFFPIL